MLPADEGPKLHFLVTDPTRELCRVAMPVVAVENLEQLFPDEDLREVKARGLDLPAIVRRARESAYAPQTLVDTQTERRSYKIWIE
ncbi:MAG TPA: hypothetical protein VI299_16250 [Polyangiales bacterium]